MRPTANLTLPNYFGDVRFVIASCRRRLQSREASAWCCGLLRFAVQKLPYHCEGGFPARGVFALPEAIPNSLVGDCFVASFDFAAKNAAPLRMLLAMTVIVSARSVIHAAYARRNILAMTCRYSSYSGIWSNDLNSAARISHCTIIHHNLRGTKRGKSRVNLYVPGASLGQRLQEWTKPT